MGLGKWFLLFTACWKAKHCCNFLVAEHTSMDKGDTAWDCSWWICWLYFGDVIAYRDKFNQFLSHTSILAVHCMCIDWDWESYKGRRGVLRNISSLRSSLDVSRLNSPIHVCPFPSRQWALQRQELIVAQFRQVEVLEKGMEREDKDKR